MKLFIDRLSKRYTKDKYGLQDFSLSVNQGILGLLGPNGAGKSTLLKMIATISKPTEGSILLNDQDIVAQPNYMREQLGYLPQDFGVYPNLNAYEFLNYIAAMKGIGGDGLKTRIQFLLEGLNLIETAKKPIGSYSGGMRQRVGIAQALLNEPKVVIFDEPTVGLDPEERVRFRNLISELADKSIVILSSHIVSDIDTIADQVAIMKAGSLITMDYPEEIIAKVKDKVFEIDIPKEQASDFKEKHMVVNTIRKKEEVTVRYIANESVDGSKKAVASLEDAYLYFTKTN
ncbi:ABC transporter ATP-binding protein [Roseivirga misakiensis]|uniref:ABC transporter ATP-binding protein n=1 Tax=Roseivirga misakiensis TaxID=1563681 RepID=A0A1E5T554_9BACT|nr:ABC transporter ATP-binding protein [Roseivirga misakiensis]OEK06505.1 ABC transporter ATP-binding protein [Roseivirga misakiensis]